MFDLFWRTDFNREALTQAVVIVIKVLIGINFFAFITTMLLMFMNMKKLVFMIKAVEKVSFYENGILFRMFSEFLNLQRSQMDLGLASWLTYIHSFMLSSIQVGNLRDT